MGGDRVKTQKEEYQKRDDEPQEGNKQRKKGRFFLTYYRERLTTRSFGYTKSLPLVSPSW